MKLLSVKFKVDQFGYFLHVATAGNSSRLPIGAGRWIELLN